MLVISYSFPPALAAGALRPNGLYRHLKGEGWEPVILTASAGIDLPNVIRVPHPRLLERLRSQLGIRTDSFGPLAGSLRRIRGLVSEVTAYPDQESGWRRAARAAGLDLQAKLGLNAIVSTSPPATAHLVARDLKKVTGLPWVADFRDLWADNYAYQWSKLRRSIDRLAEEHVLRRADALVTVSSPLAEALRRRHLQRVWPVANGFPPEDVAPANQLLSQKFTITYTGSLYRDKHDPSILLGALADLVSSGDIDMESLAIRFFGRNVDTHRLRALVAGRGLDGCVVFGGLVSREDALERQRETQLLLALDWMDAGEPGVYTSKVFEYLAARRPIVSIGPQGTVLAALLQETGAGRQFAKEAELRLFLREAYREFRLNGRVPYRGDHAKIQRYDHAAMARQFSQVLDWVVGPNADST